METELEMLISFQNPEAPGALILLTLGGGGVESCIPRGTMGLRGAFSQWKVLTTPGSSCLDVETFRRLPEDFPVSKVGAKIGLPDKRDMQTCSTPSGFPHCRLPFSLCAQRVVHFRCLLV